jgi:hypothetical protein
VLRALGVTDKDGPLRTVQSPAANALIESLYRAVVTWCLLAVAAIVAASIRRFEGWYMHLVAAAVLVGLVIVVATALAP